MTLILPGRILAQQSDVQSVSNDGSTAMIIVTMSKVLVDQVAKAGQERGESC